MQFGEVQNGLSKDDRLWVNVEGTAHAREVQGTEGRPESLDKGLREHEFGEVGNGQPK